MKLNFKSSIPLLLLALCFGCNNADNDKQASNANNGMVKEDSITSSLPKPDHVVILMEENHSYDQIIGSSLAPFINSLANEGASFSNSHGVTHPSEPNYIALFSGSTQGMEGDPCLPADQPYTTPNLGHALISAGYTFLGYAHTMPSRGYSDCFFGDSKINKGQHLYARKHCPWVNWQNAKENGLSGDSVSIPMSEFPSDFTKLPTVAMVVPDMDHDMHNNGRDSGMVKIADEWAKLNISKYAEWAKTHNSLLIVTYDEDNGTPLNKIPTIFVGQMVKPGIYNDSINHYNVLRTVEKMYGISPSGPAVADAIANVWN